MLEGLVHKRSKASQSAEAHRKLGRGKPAYFSRGFGTRRQAGKAIFFGGGVYGASQMYRLERLAGTAPARIVFHR
jgi:hypothetical protein